MATYPVRVGVMGLGGFAREHHRALRELETEGICRVVCTCDPAIDPAETPGPYGDLTERGVQLFRDWQAMLDACGGALDLVTVPTPVPLHAPMHNSIVGRKLACYLEKPPTLDGDELTTMLEAEQRAPFRTQVGFNYIIEPQRRRLKERIIAGEFGAVREAGFIGLWPRAASYYTRASWAGRLMLDGRFVLDSCVGNAMAHYIHNVLFWAGVHALDCWAAPSHLEAELYRAHAIQGADTVFCRADTECGVRLRIGATHACEGEHRHREWIVCERATLEYHTWGDWIVHWESGAEEREPIEQHDLLKLNLRAYCSYLCGEAERPVTTLEDSRPFVRWNDALYRAAGHIAQAPEEYLTRSSTDAGEFVAISGIEAVTETFATTGRLPSELHAPWAQPGRPSRAGWRQVVAQMAADNPHAHYR